MRIGVQELDWGYLGALLANQGDDAQVEFLKAFVKECRGWGTRHQVEQQMCYINLKLTSEEREVLSAITYEESK